MGESPYRRSEFLLRHAEAKCDTVEGWEDAVTIACDQPKHDEDFGCLAIQFEPLGVFEKIMIEFYPWQLRARPFVVIVLEAFPVLYFHQVSP
jgi:hypothetical protein